MEKYTPTTNDLILIILILKFLYDHLILRKIINYVLTRLDEVQGQLKSDKLRLLAMMLSIKEIIREINKNTRKNG